MEKKFCMPMSIDIYREYDMRYCKVHFSLKYFESIYTLTSQTLQFITSMQFYLKSLTCTYLCVDCTTYIFSFLYLYKE